MCVIFWDVQSYLHGTERKPLHHYSITTTLHNHFYVQSPIDITKLHAPEPVMMGSRLLSSLTINQRWHNDILCSVTIVILYQWLLLYANFTALFNLSGKTGQHRFWCPSHHILTFTSTFITVSLCTCNGMSLSEWSFTWCDPMARLLHQFMAVFRKYLAV